MPYGKGQRVVYFAKGGAVRVFAAGVVLEPKLLMVGMQEARVT